MRMRHVFAVSMAGLATGALALGLALPGLAQDMGPGGFPVGPHRFGPHEFGAHPFGPWLWAAGLLFLLRILLVTGLILVLWRVLTARTIWCRPDSATQILRERYARSEISEDEFRKRVITLT